MENLAEINSSKIIVINANSNIVFIIGGSYGIDEEIKKSLIINL